MGVGIAAAAVIGAAATTYGVSENKKAGKKNQQLQADSEEDFADRLKVAAKEAKRLEGQYNKIVKKRPNLKWDTYVKEQIRHIDDPMVRELYVNGKQEDFEALRKLASMASEDNVQNLMSAADEISGGQWKTMVQKRNDLVLNTDAAQRFTRANELAAPIREDASTVRYDDKGQLIQGQRSDKQALQLAYETQVASDREQKDDIRTLQQDTLNAAASQQQKASEFTSFFDPSGFATANAQQYNAQKTNWQLLDEKAAMDMYDIFARGAQNMQPTQPNYGPANPGDAMIKAGVEMGTSALTDYYKSKNTPKPANTYGT